MKTVFLSIIIVFLFLKMAFASCPANSTDYCLETLDAFFVKNGDLTLVIGKGDGIRTPIVNPDWQYPITAVRYKGEENIFMRPFRTQLVDNDDNEWFTESVPLLNNITNKKSLMDAANTPYTISIQGPSNPSDPVQVVVSGIKFARYDNPQAVADQWDDTNMFDFWTRHTLSDPTETWTIDIYDSHFEVEFKTLFANNYTYKTIEHFANVPFENISNSSEALYAGKPYRKTHDSKTGNVYSVTGDHYPYEVTFEQIGAANGFSLTTQSNNNTTVSNEKRKRYKAGEVNLSFNPGTSTTASANTSRSVQLKFTVAGSSHSDMNIVTSSSNVSKLLNKAENALRDNLKTFWLYQMTSSAADPTLFPAHVAASSRYQIGGTGEDVGIATSAFYPFWDPNDTSENYVALSNNIERHLRYLANNLNATSMDNANIEVPRRNRFGVLDNQLFEDITVGTTLTGRIQRDRYVRARNVDVYENIISVEQDDTIRWNDEDFYRYPDGNFFMSSYNVDTAIALNMAKTQTGNLELSQYLPNFEAWILQALNRDADNDGLYESSPYPAGNRDFIDMRPAGGYNSEILGFNLRLYKLLKLMAQTYYHYGNKAKYAQYATLAQTLKETINKDTSNGGLWSTDHYVTYHDGVAYKDWGDREGNILALSYGVPSSTRSSSILDWLTPANTNDFIPGQEFKEYATIYGNYPATSNNYSGYLRNVNETDWWIQNDQDYQLGTWVRNTFQEIGANWSHGRYTEGMAYLSNYFEKYELADLYEYINNGGSDSGQLGGAHSMTWAAGEAMHSVSRDLFGIKSTWKYLEITPNMAATENATITDYFYRGEKYKIYINESNADPKFNNQNNHIYVTSDVGIRLSTPAGTSTVQITFVANDDTTEYYLEEVGGSMVVPSDGSTTLGELESPSITVTENDSFAMEKLVASSSSTLATQSVEIITARPEIHWSFVDTLGKRNSGKGNTTVNNIPEGELVMYSGLMDSFLPESESYTLGSSALTIKLDAPIPLSRLQLFLLED